MFYAVDRKTVRLVGALMLLVIVFFLALTTMEPRPDREVVDVEGAPPTSSSHASPQAPAIPAAAGTGAAVPSGPEAALAPTLSSSARLVDVRPVSSHLVAQYRMERDQARSRRIELLEQVVSDPGTSEERKQESQAQLAELLRRSELEVVAEGLIRAQGYSDVLVTIGDSGVNVVVAQPVSSAADAARIGDAVARATGVTRERISIVGGDV